uniref:NADH-ubiquinone oxidoreductase chain 6 n=1 Tax=Eubasilissa regina TaxID=1435191 RepID=W0FDP8_EUBRE|nr:NADH dehydrogenase subunit 6 [Eubasilissa regina]AHF21728.1 NADH dehydrogenase subunit 6 [Eubasilissa regina]
MYTLMFFMFLLMSLLLLNLHHPLIITIIMIIQTTIMTLMLGSMSTSFWMSYMMFLTFIGGMLVLFIYISSLTSNKLNFLTVNKFFLMLISTILFFIYLKILFFNMNLEMNSFMTLFVFFNTENNLFLSNFYNKNEMYLTILLMMYLMLTLIIVTKISNLSYGPMRIKF